MENNKIPCPQCGRLIFSNHPFCPYCGNKLDDCYIEKKSYNSPYSDRNDNNRNGRNNNNPNGKISIPKEALPSDVKEIIGIMNMLKANLPLITSHPFDPKHNYWNDLNMMIGLNRVKTELRKEIESHKGKIKRSEHHPDLKADTSFNCIFKGNPGTGKTTVARIIGGILKQEGLIPRGHLIETSDQQLCGSFTGHTPNITKYISLLSRGGVLFIDEAYNLGNHKGSVDYGKQVIDTLTPLIENMRSTDYPLLVIMAGYEKEMDEFLANANTGFASRFQHVIHFDDYNADEMYTIFSNFAHKKHFILTPNADKMAHLLFEQVEKDKKLVKTFGNGRTVRTFFETIEKHATARISRLSLKKNSSELDQIIADDMKLSNEEYENAMAKIY